MQKLDMGEQKLHEFQENLKQLIDFNTNKLLTDFGSKMYGSNENFSYGRIYEIAGRDDCVMNITFREGTKSAEMYPAGLTCFAQYFQKDRKILESDVNALNDRKSIQVKDLLVFDDAIENVTIDLDDIDSILVTQNYDVKNTFYSNELRALNTIEVPFKTLGKGDDILWIYGFLKHCKSKDIALSPDEEAQYLAYKFIIEKELVTDDEKAIIFDDKERIIHQGVAYYFLKWKIDSGHCNESDEESIKQLLRNQIAEKLSLIDSELNKVGSSIMKLLIDNPDALKLLFNRCIFFHDIRFNIVGRHLLYLNLDGLLHIYLRHVNELSINKQFADRDKFQLVEKDIFTTMNVLLTRMNDDYQQWKENNPNKRYHWFGPRTYYNGDYYEVYVNEDGSISTFFKCSHNKK